MNSMCAECFAYRPQGERWYAAEERLFCSQECARIHLQWDARRAMMDASPIQVGDRVRRAHVGKYQVDTLGTVKALYTEKCIINRAYAYRLKARVQWDQGNRRLNGRSDIHSDVLVTALVKHDPPQCSVPGCNATENLIQHQDRVTGRAYWICRACDAELRADALATAATDRAWQAECSGQNVGPRGFTLSRGRT